MAQGADVHAQARGRFFQPKDEGGYFYFGEEGPGGAWGHLEEKLGAGGCTVMSAALTPPQTPRAALATDPDGAPYTDRVLVSVPEVSPLRNRA